MDIAEVATKTIVKDVAPQQATADASTLNRGMFHGQSDKLQPGMGVLPRDWFESTFMPAALRRVANSRAPQERSLQHAEWTGDSVLRASLSRKRAAIGIEVQPMQIVTPAIFERALAHCIDQGQLTPPRRAPAHLARWRPQPQHEAGARLLVPR